MRDNKAVVYIRNIIRHDIMTTHYIHTSIDVIKFTLTLITVVVLLITLSVRKLICYMCAMLKRLVSNSLAFFNEDRPHQLVSEGVASNLRDPDTLYNKNLELGIIYEKRIDEIIDKKQFYNKNWNLAHKLYGYRGITDRIDDLRVVKNFRKNI